MDMARSYMEEEQWANSIFIAEENIKSVQARTIAGNFFAVPSIQAVSIACS